MLGYGLIRVPKFGLETTALYTHVATEVLRKVISPLETLPPS